ncbi:MAG: GNAT family N-acetyltransferase [Planctomycetota bacterium]|nr:GNAT family N-acetyltransferase [Planctomycetota bacterium]
MAQVEIRPARLRDAGPLAAFHEVAPPPPGGAEAADPIYMTDLRARVLAVSGGEIVGTCRYQGAAGHCAVVPAPRLLEWDEALAAQLLRAAAGHAFRRHGARLIQSLTEPEGASPLALAVERAGFDRLAVLSYMRRPIRPEDRLLEPPPSLAWHPYSLFRHRLFARTILSTYRESLDCPKLTGLRPINDTIATHKHTGTFRPRTWRLAIAEGKPTGVVLVSENQGRGDLVYLGVVPEARRRGIGRALMDRAIRDTAEVGLPQMGLAVDVSNIPAMRLYERAGFREIRRRLAHFVPGDRLEGL